MLQFVIVNIVMISAGVILYLVIRALPRIDEEEAPSRKANFLDRWAASELPEKFDVILNSFLEKILRRVKIFLLKIDNTLSGRLKKIKTENGKKESLIDGFKKLSEDKRELTKEGVQKEGK